GAAAAVEGEVRVRAEGNHVVVTIEDKKLLAQLFSSKPTVVEFESALPGEEKVATRIVPITYENTSATAAQGPKSDQDLLQGTWRGIAGMAMGQRLPDADVKQVIVKFNGDTMETPPSPGNKGGKGTFV